MIKKAVVYAPEKDAYNFYVLENEKAKANLKFSNSRYKTLEEQYGVVYFAHEQNQDEVKHILEDEERTPFEYNKGVQNSRTYYSISQNEYHMQMQNHTAMKNEYDIAGIPRNYFSKVI